MIGFFVCEESFPRDRLKVVGEVYCVNTLDDAERDAMWYSLQSNQPRLVYRIDLDDPERACVVLKVEAQVSYVKTRL